MTAKFCLQLLNLRMVVGEPVFFSGGCLELHMCRPTHTAGQDLTVSSGGKASNLSYLLHLGRVVWAFFPCLFVVLS